MTDATFSLEVNLDLFDFILHRFSLVFFFLVFFKKKTRNVHIYFSASHDRCFPKDFVTAATEGADQFLIMFFFPVWIHILLCRV